MKNRNAGFSLVELIVVVAMIAVLSVIGATWLSRISGYRVRETTSKLTNSLSAAKIKVMSKERNTGDGYWLLEKDANDGRYYVSICTPKYSAGGATPSSWDVDKTKVSKAGYVRVSTDGGSTYIESGNPLYLSWHRGTGSFWMSTNGSTWTESTITAIDVSGGGRNYTITLVPVTGKVIGRN